MFLRNSFFLALIFLSSFLNAQVLVIPPSYQKTVELAENLYQKQNYLKAAQTFTKAFQILKGRGFTEHRYMAARCWALIHETDSAFFYLKKVAQNDFTDFDGIAQENDLLELHDDSRWLPIISTILKNKQALEKNYNYSLIRLLDTIYQDDQKPRLEADSIETKYGVNSLEAKKSWSILGTQDSINTIKISKILDEFGWLGEDVIGSKGNETLFLVIQHADLSIQKKYLPLLQNAVKTGKAQKSHLAYLTDRIEVREGRPQVYGTQFSAHSPSGKLYISPIVDVENLEKRREEMELIPMKMYVTSYNIRWSIKRYKKDLKKYE